jgi:uncharacterized protein
MAGAAAWAADEIPPKPSQHFNDYAGVTSPAARARLNQELQQFERDSSSQIVVAIFRKIPDGAALEDFTARTATAWKVGREAPDNGAVLFLFVADRRMRIEVGYGLEGKIADAVAKRITSEQIRPALQRGDYDAAMTAGVRSLIQAARGEYKGSGKTVDEESRRRGTPIIFFVFFALFLVFLAVKRASRGSVYGRRGYTRGGGWPIIWSGGGGGWGGSSGGGFSGGGFSGGGGSFGGGGASDSW